MQSKLFLTYDIFYTIGIYRVAHGLEKCQQEFYFCMENSAMDAATTTVFEPSNPAT